MPFPKQPSTPIPPPFLFCHVREEKRERESGSPEPQCSAVTSDTDRGQMSSSPQTNAAPPVRKLKENERLHKKERRVKITVFPSTWVKINCSESKAGSAIMGASHYLSWTPACAQTCESSRSATGHSQFIRRLHRWGAWAALADRSKQEKMMASFIWLLQCFIYLITPLARHLVCLSQMVIFDCTCSWEWRRAGRLRQHPPLAQH